jgi:hypothetical protein
VVSHSAVIAKSLVLALVAAVLMPAGARAETFTVNTQADSLGPTGCPGVCTVRAAINAAAGNAAGTDDVVEIPAGEYTLNPQLSWLAVGSNATRITIRGAGAHSTSIVAPSGSGIRVLALASGSGVALTDLTLRGGNVTTGVGGNIWVQSQATLALSRVRISDGKAPQGGGIAAAGATLLDISASLIDGNAAAGVDSAELGGGIYVQGQTTATPITIRDSTITQNSAQSGGGIGMTNNVGQPPTLRGVTLARNSARGGIGGIYSQNTNARFQGSIVAGNTSTVNFGQGPITAPSNCGLASAAVDEGGNVTSDATDTCGLGGVHTDPQLATALDGSSPPALAIPANSSAVDAADCAGRTQDQRGVARPQLARCDAGAYEYQPPPPEPTPTPTASPAPTATPTPTSTPVAGRSVRAVPVRGTVLVKLRGSSRFVPLSPSVIENGAEVDTRKGRVEITRSDGGRAIFYDGIVKLSQTTSLTTLTLTEKLAPCPSKRARIAAKKPKTRKLWGDGKGRFRTKGQYGAATVRGTKWLIQDGCRYTRVRVTQGSVRFRDEVKKKTIIVRKGKSYTARAKK